VGKIIKIVKRDVMALKDLAERADAIHKSIATTYHNADPKVLGEEDCFELQVDLEQIQKCSDHLYEKFCR